MLKVQGKINTRITNFRIFIDPVAINVLKLKKVKKEDKELLEQLRNRLEGRRVTILIH